MINGSSRPATRGGQAAHAQIPDNGDPVKPPIPNEVHSPLRQDIRLLGRTLGEVIRDCEGRAVYDVIEKLRRAAVKFRREGLDRDGRMLERQIRRLADGEANSVARAFSYFLHLSNIAEDRDQTRRQRLHWQAEGPATPGSLRHAVDLLQNAGLSGARIRQHLASACIVPMSYADTAGAAAFIKEQGDPAAAAIAPKLAAELYGLKVIEDNVEDANDNTTRFVVLARAPLDPASLAGETAITTLVFEVRNVPAALYKALGGFATNGVNMTKLESYQKGASFAATAFFADIVGAPGEPAVDRAIEELAFHCKDLRILGTYRQARPRG